MATRSPLKFGGDNMVTRIIMTVNAKKLEEFSPIEIAALLEAPRNTVTACLSICLRNGLYFDRVRHGVYRLKDSYRFAEGDE